MGIKSYQLCQLTDENYYLISVEIPQLEQLYLGSNDHEMIETKWKIFRWIMSLSDDVITAMKKLPKKFLLICASLYALVRVRQ